MALHLTPSYVCRAWCSIKHRDNFMSTFLSFCIYSSFSCCFFCYYIFLVSHYSHYSDELWEVHQVWDMDICVKLTNQSKLEAVKCATKLPLVCPSNLEEINEPSGISTILHLFYIYFCLTLLINLQIFNLPMFLFLYSKLGWPWLYPQLVHKVGQYHFLHSCEI
jgi:hypothetical protein